MYICLLGTMVNWLVGTNLYINCRSINVYLFTRNYGKLVGWHECISTVGVLMYICLLGTMVNWLVSSIVHQL